MNNMVMRIPESEDGDTLDCFKERITCKHCDLPEAIMVECGVMDLCHPLHYKQQRLRIVYKCLSCKKEMTFRVGWMEVKGGSYVKP